MTMLTVELSVVDQRRRSVPVLIGQFTQLSQHVLLVTVQPCHHRIIGGRFTAAAGVRHVSVQCATVTLVSSLHVDLHTTQTD